jgi:hypothetical protein
MTKALGEVVLGEVKKRIPAGRVGKPEDRISVFEP